MRLTSEAATGGAGRQTTDTAPAIRIDTVNIRPATDSDLDAINALYNKLGVATTASYDLEPISLDERRAWYDDHLANDYPVLVAESDEQVVGFATYGQFRSKAGFRFTVEHSIYIDADQQSTGIGRSLMQELIKIAESKGLHAMVGVVDAINTTSIAFHQELGFVIAGVLPQIGRKFDRWGDLTFLVLLLSQVSHD